MVFDSSNLSIRFMQRKRIPLKVEKGTGGMADVDISWIPQETLNAMSTSTRLFQQWWKWEWSYARIWFWQFCLTDKASPKASPRKRANRANRAAGADQWERFLPSLYLKGNQHFWNLVSKLNSVFVLIQPAEASICSDESHFNTSRTELQLVLKGTFSSPHKCVEIRMINLSLFRENLK